MTTAAESIRSQALSLDEFERLSLAEAFLASLGQLDDPQFHSDWLVEIKRRSVMVDSGQSTLRPWSKVKAAGRKIIESHHA